MVRNEKESRLLISSNRLPVIIEEKNGVYGVRQGSGGLVTALAPILKNRGGVWIGWSGSSGGNEATIRRMLEKISRNTGFTMYNVPMSDEDVKDYYYGFSNEIIWPLYHNLETRCKFEPSYWTAYVRINQRFARVIEENLLAKDYVWIHDYHLMLVARELRARVPETSIGFFLHIPFPPLDIFMKLPWRFQILRALLDYDLIGFQTVRDQRNFVQCVRTLLRDVAISSMGSNYSCIVGDRKVRVGCFPISIDYREFAQGAESREIAEEAWYIHEKFPNTQLLLGVDRLDYTKGIPFRLAAFRNALQRYPELREKITLIQVVVPSRTDIPEYLGLKTEIERLVGEINGEFTTTGWVPIHYMFRSLTRSELLALYRTAEIALITPLKDGMNLVAKEYCAAQVEENGVIILSEFAGAAMQLHRYAIIVNPYDIEGLANAILQAFEMTQEQRRTRMRKMRNIIRRQNIGWWLDAYLQAAFSKDLMDFPIVEEFVPEFQDTEHYVSSAILNNVPGG